MEGSIELLIQILLPIGLILLGFLIGSHVEKKHIRDLDKRDDRLRNMVQCNIKRIPSSVDCDRAEFVAGEVVIASDYFKTFAATIRNFFGGEVRSLETLMDRARREAKLRILEQAASLGANAVWNIRYETTMVGRTSGKKKAAMAEIYAYGTALWLRPKNE